MPRSPRNPWRNQRRSALCGASARTAPAPSSPPTAGTRRAVRLLFVGCAVLAVMAGVATPAHGQQNPVQTCPLAADIAPCACSVKKNGLDILCETTDINHINRAMGTLKGRNPIIFYLKLRHNTLPKLQGFVFLGLDIRHLTIHNSSLAVIEETALSSLGECRLLCGSAGGR